MYTKSSTARYSEHPRKQYRCMNCGKTITSPEGNMYTRRFCSVACKEEYIKE